MAQIQYDELNKFLINKQCVIGCDEVGYGSIAGPLCVCGVHAPKDWNLGGLNDSKKLSLKRRELIRDKLLDLAKSNIITFYMAERTNYQIDEFGLGIMLKDCYLEIFNNLYTPDSLLICDGNLKFDNLNMDQVSIIRGDTLIPAIMAASILAKTYRDKKMKRLHFDYPQYDWIKNVGYLTSNHIVAIKKYGLTPLHRKSYNLKCLK